MVQQSFQKKSSWMLQLLSSVMHSRYHKRLGLYRPSTSTLLMRSTISCSVICRRSPFMTVISSLLVMQPSLSLSNSANASRNSSPTIHTHIHMQVMFADASSSYSTSAILSSQLRHRIRISRHHFTSSSALHQP